ncbi:MAG: DNA polymerase III subunit delta [Nitrospira sp.]|nr:MAG: DNA polymerase III subunit delta [Nitrospira sp.]
MASALNSLQLESALKQQAPGPLYLIVGEEDLLRDSALAALKAAVLGDGGEFNYDLFYGDEASGADIRNCASEMPVFAERRLVVVKTAEKLSAKESETLLDYLKDPVETTTLVFVSPKLDGRLKFSQALARTAITIDCLPLRDAQLTPWVARDAERVGIRLEEHANQLLKEVSGGSLYGVRRELEKLASYVPSGRTVTAADVLVLRGMEPGASVFDLTLAIAAGNRGRVLSILARNLEAGEAPLRILGSLAWQYRRLWKVKELLANGGREGEAARTLQMDPMKVRSFTGRFSDEHLQAALHLFLDADGKLKGGSSGRPKMVLEGVLLRLCEYVKSTATESLRRPPVPAGRVPARVVSNVRTITRGNRTGR